MGMTPSSLIFDSSVLFDIQNSSSFGYVSKLLNNLLVTDIILNDELETIDAPTLLSYGFQTVQLSPEEMLSLQNYRTRFKALSVGDLSCLVYAENHNAVIIAGDKNLRALATQKMIEVHGSLWLLDELIELGIITPAKAAAALKLMLENDAWLPLDECEMRMKAWL